MFKENSEGFTHAPKRHQRKFSDVWLKIFGIWHRISPSCNQKDRYHGRNAVEGFTLAELLVSLAITTIVSMVAIISFQGFNNQNRLNGERDKVLGDMLDVKGFSANWKLIPRCDATGGVCNSSCSGSCSLSILPQGGYGVYFINNSANPYTLFADINNDHAFNSPTEELSNGVKILPTNVKFKEPPRYYSNSTSSWVTSLFPIGVFFKLDRSSLVQNVIGAFNPDIRILEIVLHDTENNIYSSFYINSHTGVIYSYEPLAGPVYNSSPVSVATFKPISDLHPLTIVDNISIFPIK